MKPNASFINTERIEGYVYSTGSGFNELSERVSGETSKHPGTHYIAGDLDIAVDDDGLNVISIHYTYVTEVYGKSGKRNGTYATLKQIIDNPDRHWINGGKENAYKISCTGVSIGVNDFIASDGTKVAALRNEGGFCSLVNQLCDVSERNTFITDMLITKAIHVEADPDKNIDKEYMNLSGCIFGFGPKIIPATFVVRADDGIRYFDGLDTTPATPVFTKVWGHINCMTIKYEKREETAFGDAAVQTFERKSREYTVERSALVPYEFGDEDVLTIADVNKMMQDRQTMLAEVEKRHNDRQAKKAANNVISGNGPAMNIPEGGFVF